MGPDMDCKTYSCGWFDWLRVCPSGGKHGSTRNGQRPMSPMVITAGHSKRPWVHRSLFHFGKPWNPSSLCICRPYQQKRSVMIEPCNTRPISKGMSWCVPCTGWSICSADRRKKEGILRRAIARSLDTGGKAYSALHGRFHLTSGVMMNAKEWTCGSGKQKMKLCQERYQLHANSKAFKNNSTVSQSSVPSTHSICISLIPVLPRLSNSLSLCAHHSDLFSRTSLRHRAVGTAGWTGRIHKRKGCDSEHLGHFGLPKTSTLAFQRPLLQP